MTDRIDLQPVEPTEATVLTAAAQIITSRLRAEGSGAGVCIANGMLVLSVRLANRPRVARLATSVGRLELRPVLEVVRSPVSGLNCSDPSTYPEAEPGQVAVMCARTLDQQTGGYLPISQWEALKVGPATSSEAIVESAAAAQREFSWSVDVTLTTNGAAGFKRITGELACNPHLAPTRQLAVILDGLIEGHPQMGEEIQCNSGISGDQMEISGFTEERARDVAILLRFGPLPIRLRVKA
ncbi:MAG: SecDF P1 head subdomain-containing protein [Actinomycetota bacterium]